MVFIIVLFILFSCQNDGTRNLKEEGSTFFEDSSITFESINAVIKSDPNNPDHYKKRAELHMKLFSWSEAKSDIGRALMLDSTNCEFIVLYADILFATGKTIQSRSELNRCLQFGENIPALMKLGEIYLLGEKYQESIEYLNRVLKVDLRNAEAYFMKGMAFKYLGDTTKALSNFETAREQDNEYYEPCIQIGLIYASAHNPIAVDYYNNAIRITPSSIEAIYAKSLFLQEHGNPEKAVEGYQLILKIEPKNIPALYNTAYINLKFFSDFEKAQQGFGDVLILDKNHSDATYNLGVIQELNKNYSKAREYYKKTLSMSPQHTLAAQGMSRLDEL